MKPPTEPASFIELGWPGSHPKDKEVFARARDVDVAQVGELEAAGASVKGAA